MRCSKIRVKWFRSFLILSDPIPRKVMELEGIFIIKRLEISKSKLVLDYHIIADITA